MMTSLQQLAALDQLQRRREQDQTVPISEIESEVVKWIFNPWIPAAKISVVFGEPGVGKSNFTLDIAARLSIGCAMPNVPHSAGLPLQSTSTSTPDVEGMKCSVNTACLPVPQSSRLPI
jgi:hypothetical protein